MRRVLSNGSYICNTVRDCDLQSNIEYNEMFRPGRYYFVDGDYVCGGFAKGEELQKQIIRYKTILSALNLQKSDKASIPYR